MVVVIQCMTIALTDYLWPSGSMLNALHCMCVVGYQGNATMVVVLHIIFMSMVTCQCGSLKFGRTF